MQPLDHSHRVDLQIRYNMYRLELPNDRISPGALLGAIAYKETAYGKYREYARRESAYTRGGVYYNNDVRALYKRYGDFVPNSYGTWQILYVTANELGYKSHPAFLMLDRVCIRWAIEYINRRAFAKGAETPEDVFDAYNTGNHLDSNVPVKYVNEAMGFYVANVDRYEKSPETPTIDT